MQSISGYTLVYRKEKLFRIWLSWEPLVFLWHPETVEKVLSNNFLLQKSSQYGFLHPWLGTGLLTSEGTKWRTRRKMLVPAFHFKILHDFVPVFNEQARILVTRLQSVARRKCTNCTVVDIVPVITACTLDIICGEFNQQTQTILLLLMPGQRTVECVAMAVNDGIVSLFALLVNQCSHVDCNGSLVNVNGAVLIILIAAIPAHNLTTRCVQMLTKRTMQTSPMICLESCRLAPYAFATLHYTT